MLKASDVAAIFLKLSQPDLGDVLTNLKLQKLVYYAQGFNLAINGEKLFEEDILAWEHGPIVRELYEELKVHGGNALPVPDDISGDATDDQVSLIEEVNQVYGQFSAWKLRDMTHNEVPWLATARNEVISPDLMKEYFVTLVK